MEKEQPPVSEEPSQNAQLAGELEAMLQQRQSNEARSSTETAERSELPEALKPQSGELPEAYLLRASAQEYDTGKVSFERPIQRTETKWAHEIFSERQSLLTSRDRREFSSQQVAQLAHYDLRGIAPVKPGEANAEAFRGTMRSRGVLSRRGSGASGYESYASKLFVQSEAPNYLEPALAELNGKNIVNLGGGNAAVGHQLAELGIKPETVYNVEPFPDQERPPEADPVVQANPAEADFFEKQNTVKPGSAQEVWAVWSVPFYLEQPDQVSNFVVNVGRLLAPDGIARLSPVAFNANSSEEVVPRKAAFIQGLNELIGKGYAIEATHGTLFIKAPTDGS